MRKLSSIVVFSNEQNLLILLQSYCFTKKITLTALDFTMNGVREIAKFKPGLVILPFSQSTVATSAFEISSLKREIKKIGNVRVCALADEQVPVCAEISSWADIILYAPIDLREVDEYVKQAFLDIEEHMERRYRERRSCPDRRNHYLESGIYPEFQQKNVRDEHPACLGFQLDDRNKCLFLNANKVELTPKEYELIELLMTDVDRIFLTEEIVKHLWPENTRATKSDLYQYMHMLRKKIELDPNNPKWLMNVKGYGYKLNLS